MNIYLAGGAVRDLLLGTPLTDRDYLVTGTTKQEFMKRFPTATEVGRAFPVFLLDKQEFSFSRATTLNEELMARDLTVNALLLTEDGNLICHSNALEDLHTRTLRPASPQSFTDDPLRVFRAARFWARYPDFIPHDELITSMQTVAQKGLLKTIAADRIGQETIKAMAAKSPGNFLRLLAKANCLTPWFKEFEGGLSIPAGPAPYHDTNVIEHTCRVMDSLSGDSQAVWMGLCHDIGKTLTPTAALPSHHGHDKRGIPLAENLAKRIRLSNTFMTMGAKAAQWHMIAAKYDELRPGTRVDLLMDLHVSRTFNQLLSLVEVDQDKNYHSHARNELRTILSARLPEEAMNCGAESGRILREIRAQKLTDRIKK